MSEVVSIKVKDNLYVNCLPVTIKKEKNGTKEVPQHQVIIIDRSGSMYGCIKSLVDNVIEYCKNLPDGSTVSVGYFSGVNEYNLSVPYTLQKEINGVVTTLNTYKHTLGLTNFIEILNKVVSSTSGKASFGEGESE